MQINQIISPIKTDFFGEIDVKKETKSVNIAKESLFKKVEDLSHYEQLIDRIQQFIIPKSVNDPFYGTDLIVFKDTYKGSLPLNGIREMEYDQIKQFYLNFEQEKEVFGTSRIIIDGDQTFKNRLQAAIKTLLTRAPGRELLVEVVKNYDIFTIKEDSETSSQGNTVFINGHDIYETVTLDRKGNKVLSEHPFFLILAHEFIHSLHHQEVESNVKLSPNLSLISEKGIDQDFGDLEEQFTITGLKSPLQFDSTEDKVYNRANWEIWKKEMKEDISHKQYSEFSENRLRVAFGYLPRLDHSGHHHVPKPTNLNDQTSKQFKKYFEYLIEKEDLDKLKELIDLKIDWDKGFFNVTDDDNIEEDLLYTPIETAVYLGKQKVINFFLENGAKIQPTNKNGDSILNICVMGCDDEKIFEWLSNNGAELKTDDSMLLYSVIDCGRINILRFLDKKGFSLNQVSPYTGENGCHLATMRGDVQILDFLAKKGANLNQENKEKRTPLELAIKYGHLNAVQYFISIGQDVNAVNSHGESLCQIAQIHQKDDILQFLIDKGARI